MSTEYARPTKGKGWKAVPSTDDTDGWCVVHPTKKIATGGTRGRAVTFTKDRATRYALALNVADAGVDLVDVEMQLRNAANLLEQDRIARAFQAHKIRKLWDTADALARATSIANAAEGMKP